MYGKWNTLRQCCCCYTNLIVIAQYIEEYCMLLYLGSGTCFLFCLFPHSQSLVEAGSPPQNVNKSKYQQINQITTKKQFSHFSFSCKDTVSFPPGRCTVSSTCIETRKEPKRKNLNRGAGILSIYL